VKQSPRYEFGMLLILTLANGVVAFDRVLASYLSPYLVKDLQLNNAQLGWIASALSLSIAFSAYLGGRLVDLNGRRKTMLIACTLVFSLGSAASGMAQGFLALLTARFLLGIAEGPMVPVSQTVLAQISAPARRGFNQGFAQMAGAFGLASTLGPLLAVWIADHYGWRTAFFVSAVPGLVLVLALLLTMRPDEPVPRAKSEVSQGPGFIASLGELLAIRNMRFVLALAGSFTAWLVLQNVYLPVYLTGTKGLTPAEMSHVLSLGGVAGLAGGITLPLLSDFVGRRAVCVIAGLATLIAPLAMLYLPGDPVLMAGAIFVGWLPLGMAPLFCSIVPGESVPPHLATSAVGLAMGTAELLGGVLAPIVVGPIADARGLDAVFWICVGLALTTVLAAIMLSETAPRKLETSHA
jgi:MFS family permease